MPEYLHLAGGTLYDPANGIDGEVRDLWVSEGKVIAEPAAAAQTAKGATVLRVDLSGLVVMPGGIDLHCHIAGTKVNVGRRMRVDDKRRLEDKVPRTPLLPSGTLGSVPSTFSTGYKYLALGYTTAFDAAVAPLLARHTHEEFADTPCIDKGFYVLMGNNHYIMNAIRNGETERLETFMAWLISTTQAYAPKVVNAGGIEVWKQSSGGHNQALDTAISHFDITPRQILQGIATAANELGLPHPVHIHCNGLGIPGNWQVTLQTMESLEGRRGHLTHIQFHSYGGGEGDENTFNSKVAPLADYVNSHPNITVDVGQVMFGNTTSMTGDGPLGYYLANLTGSKWYSSDTEMESGCGISPIAYKNKNFVHAMQWAIGLEWYLLVNDPWQVVMSTDHPNGGSFLAYPQIIRLLMDRTYRQEVLKTCPALLLERSQLADMTREYTLNEIAIITRAGPARILGLKDKGHLGLGADADITVYTPHANAEIMFSLPRMVFKAGQLLMEEGDLRQSHFGQTLRTTPVYDIAQEKYIQGWFNRHYSVRFGNYAMNEQA